ncbi:MAG: hypothetical protein HWN80_09210 [Candidatus Lokiarchaeota archaeon]|nr:hypothetical protein [Candidatus Lokiarchaeota archaeon]
MRTTIVLAFNVVFLLILFLFNISIFRGSINIPYNIVVLLEGLLFLTVPLFLVAYFIQLSRLYVYALLLGSGFFLADISSIIVPIPFNFLFTYLLLGGIIIVVGITYLIRFIKKYQLPQEEKNSDGGTH